MCVVQTSMFDANDVITSTIFFKAFYAQKQFKNQVRLWLGKVRLWSGQVRLKLVQVRLWLGQVRLGYS